MKAGIASIRKELNGLYSSQETDNLIAMIFEKLKGYSRTKLLLVGDEVLTESERNSIFKIVTRLKNHEPIQYILGSTEFYGLELQCVPEVLIPRPETEELVDWIVKENAVSNPTIIDIGTGTGCIAISLRKSILQSTVLACDISPVCLETATQNAQQNNAAIEVVEYDIITGQPLIQFPEFDIVVSNPPYVRESEKALMEKNVTGFEPELALFVTDENPLIFYKKIADFAQVHLKNQGKLYFEINEALGDETCNMLASKGFANIRLRRDINGKNRMVGCDFFRSERG